MSDKDFKVKNKLIVNGLNNASGVILSTNNQIDSHTLLPTQYGGTGTTTSPNAGQVLYSSAGATYTPTTLSSLVTPVSYLADAPSSPVVGQIWVESDSEATAFDTNIIRRQAFTATANQTVFTTTVSFVDTYEQVFFNGLLLLRTTDYTTSNNNTITLTSGAAAGDIVEVVTVTPVTSINTYTQAEIQAGYVSKSGGSTITASSASVIPIVAKGATSQSANLQEWQNSTGTPVSYINSSGVFVSTAGAYLQVSGGGGYGIQSTAGSTSTVPIIAQGAASQTANLQQWQNSGGTILGAFNASGGLELNGKDVEIMNIMGAF